MICVKCKKETGGVLSVLGVRLPICEECFFAGQKPRRRPAQRKRDTCLCGQPKGAKAKTCVECRRKLQFCASFAGEIQGLAKKLNVHGAAAAEKSEAVREALRELTAVMMPLHADL